MADQTVVTYLVPFVWAMAAGSDAGKSQPQELRLHLLGKPGSISE
ncbi:hypothetical protein MED193_11932 [Roseobacter sp. MED193]|nr:hypothetical protein [Roseobacter sp. MED193]EAQ43337.1 hypothetical protein MED193_11932 [Roseobacter sp. MED193]